MKRRTINPDDYKPSGDGALYALPTPIRDTSAPCASGDKCMTDPPARVEIRGEQCGACLRVQREMRARLREKR